MRVVKGATSSSSSSLSDCRVCINSDIRTQSYRIERVDSCFLARNPVGESLHRSLFP